MLIFQVNVFTCSLKRVSSINFFKFISENNYEDTVSSFSEIDEELIKKFDDHKQVVSLPVS